MNYRKFTFLMALFLIITPEFTIAQNNNADDIQNQQNSKANSIYGNIIAPSEAERRYWTEQDFRERYINKTVHLKIGSRHYGSEYFMKQDRSLWIGPDGQCQPGQWQYIQQQFCFAYGQDTANCWRIFDADGHTYAQASFNGLLLQVYAVDEKPLTCDPELFS